MYVKLKSRKHYFSEISAISEGGLCLPNLKTSDLATCLDLLWPV